MVTCDQIRGGIKAFLMDAVAITVAGPPQYSITTTPELYLVSGGSKRACLVVRTNTMALVWDYTAIIVTSQKFVFASLYSSGVPLPPRGAFFWCAAPWGNHRDVLLGNNLKQPCCFWYSFDLYSACLTYPMTRMSCLCYV